MKKANSTNRAAKPRTHMPTSNGKSMRLDSAHDKMAPAVSGVVGVVGTSTNSKTQASPGTSTLPIPVANDLVWDEDAHAADNYAALGKRLANCKHLYRGPEYGLIVVRPGNRHIEIMKGADLFPIVVDRVRVTVIKDGKNKGSQIPSTHLNAMLKAEAFLGQFQAVDLVTKTPMYLPNYTLTKPGYNDGGPGNRIIYDGVEASSSDSMDTINKFLEVMDFDTTADETNTVAAALTVMFRNFWPGGKPIILCTATKSHAGKDTAICFAAGSHRSVSISYQPADWAVERNLVGAVKFNPDTGVVVIENARLGQNDACIASAIIERFATDPEPMLFSTGTGGPVRRRNDIVLAISTNYGMASKDILNRSLPIHLSPKGNVADRHPDIGNPRHEFLPENREQIAAELRGMIDRWIAAGRPLDETVRHPFSLWAKTIGGILTVNKFTDFLANYRVRTTADDPLRRGLAILGAARTDEWVTAADWAALTVKLGLVKAIIPAGDRDSDEGRRRGIGRVLSSHEDETFIAENDAAKLTLKLERFRRRFDGGEPHYRYRFVKVTEELLSEDRQDQGAGS